MHLHAQTRTRAHAYARVHACGIEPCLYMYTQWALSRAQRTVAHIGARLRLHTAATRAQIGPHPPGPSYPRTRQAAYLKFQPRYTRSRPRCSICTQGTWCQRTRRCALGGAGRNPLLILTTARLIDICVLRGSPFLLFCQFFGSVGHYLPIPFNHFGHLMVYPYICFN